MLSTGGRQAWPVNPACCASLRHERVFEQGVGVRVMGIDPGLSRCGIGVIDGSHRRARVVTAGVVRSDPGDDIPSRLHHLFDEVVMVLGRTRPEAVAVERTFFTVNVRTAMGVAQAAGVAMLAAQQAGVAVHEYTPTRMKAVVTGNGAADKEQVAFMVRTHLRLADAPQPADVADALALALCHLWECHPGGGATNGGGLSPRLAAAVEAAGPGAPVVNAPAGERGPDRGVSA